MSTASLNITGRQPRLHLLVSGCHVFAPPHTISRHISKENAHAGIGRPAWLKALHTLATLIGLQAVYESTVVGLVSHDIGAGCHRVSRLVSSHHSCVSLASYEHDTAEGYIMLI